MAVTRFADLIIPEIFVPYILQRTAELSALWQSRLIDQNDTFNGLASGGGSTVNLPFFQDLTGNSEILSQTTPLTANNITAAKDVGAINYRGKMWGSNFLAKAKSGEDPMAAIGDLVAAWWARDMQTTLVSLLKGVFASTTMAAEHVLNLSIADGNAAVAGNLISSSATINAFKKLGDAVDAVTSIAMHSDIYWELVRQDVIEFESPSEQLPQIARYKGKAVIVDDGLPKVAGGTSGYVYDTYMFGDGAIAYGEATLDPAEAAETDRDIAQGDDFLVNRRQFIIHPKGVKWIGTAANASPSNTEFATAGNWARVYERKNVPLVCLKTNG